MDRREKALFFSRSPFYFVTCEALSRGRSDEQVVEEVLEGGIRLVQFRDKLSSKTVLETKARRLRVLTRNHGALLVINDHVDLALAVGADGVHLGQGDITVADARSLSFQKDPSLLIGLSTHNQEEIVRAMTMDLDYINVGPVYPTETKRGSDPDVGEEFVRAMAAQITTPFSVMGGIKKENLASLWKSLVESSWNGNGLKLIQPVAMITEICQQEKITLAVEELLTIYDQKNVPLEMVE